MYIYINIYIYYRREILWGDTDRVVKLNLVHHNIYIYIKVVTNITNY